MLAETAERLARGGRKIVVVHGNADMDAIGSAYAISKCFPPADIYAPNGVDRVAAIAVEKLGIEILEECDLSSYDSVVVVDTSSPDQFRPAAVEIPEGSVVIDHHAPSGKWDKMHFLCDQGRTSCCEIVLDLIDERGAEIDRGAAFALLGGMLTDSGHFQYADPALLRSFSSLMERAGIHMDEAVGLTRAATGPSERVAVLKALGRSRFERIGDLVVAAAAGGSFEASSCKALLSSGADVAFVGSQRDEEFRISARATQDAVRSGIHLGELLGGLGSETLSEGGGHGGAAGMSGIGDAEAVLHMCVMRTMEKFREIRAAKGPDAER